jgi:hypothetical protein
MIRRRITTAKLPAALDFEDFIANPERGSIALEPVQVLQAEEAEGHILPNQRLEELRRLLKPLSDGRDNVLIVYERYWRVRRPNLLPGSTVEIRPSRARKEKRRG